MIRYIDEINPAELEGKPVLVRVDFDVPVDETDKITETFRIQAHADTVNYLLAAGAKVALVSHGGPRGSFEFTTEQIGMILGQTLTLVPLSELKTVPALLKAGLVLLVDNIRQDPREEENDEGFAKELARGFALYINDAFAALHRPHASLVAIAQYLPAYAGLLVKKELSNLTEILAAPVRGKVAVLGGAKISTKLPVIKNLLDKVEKILIGGALANNFFKAQGFKIGSSTVDDAAVLTFLSPAELRGERESKIVLPKDIVISTKGGGARTKASPLKNLGFTQLIVDIGPESAKMFAGMIKNAKMVIWNGPMGWFEKEDFSEGTAVVARAVAEAAQSMIGGGDTLAAVTKLGLGGKFGHVSTGGGAMLEFLAGKRLPALEALNYYD